MSEPKIVLDSGKEKGAWKIAVRRATILVVVWLSLVVALPVLAAAPAEGTVYEGASVPGIALGDTRPAVEDSVGPARRCESNDDPPTMSSCTFDVEGGWVSVRYQGPDGGGATGSPDDIVFSYDRRTVTARILVLDEQDRPVADAAVSGFWVYPVNRNNNTSLFVSGTTANDGYATFTLASSRPGDFRLNIEQVSKDGFEFDYDGSVLVGRFTRPKK